MPENARGHGTPGGPLPGHLREAVLVRPCAQTFHLMHRIGQCDITMWPNIGVPQRKNPVHVGRPRSDPPNGQQCGAAFFLWRRRNPAEAHLPRHDVECEVVAIPGLLSREAHLAQSLCTQLHHTRGTHTASVGTQSPVHGACGVERHLLLEDHADKGRKAGLPRPERRRPETLYDTGQRCVLRRKGGGGHLERGS